MTPRTYQAMVIRSALKLYAETGIKANASYSPTNMMRATFGLTGKEFKPRDYQGAYDALTAIIGDGKVYQLKKKAS